MAIPEAAVFYRFTRTEHFPSFMLNTKLLEVDTPIDETEINRFRSELTLETPRHSPELEDERLVTFKQQTRVSVAHAAGTLVGRTELLTGEAIDLPGIYVPVERNDTVSHFEALDDLAKRLRAGAELPPYLATFLDVCFLDASLDESVGDEPDAVFWRTMSEFYTPDVTIYT